jgi:type IV secretion system protein VirD4
MPDHYVPEDVLYTLPTFSRTGRQTTFFQTVVLLGVNTVLAALHATAYLAWRWRFHPALGPAWRAGGTAAALGLLAAAVAATAILGALAVRRRSAAVLALLPALVTLYLAAFVPLYPAFGFWTWSRRFRHSPALAQAGARGGLVFVGLAALYGALVVAYSLIRLSRFRTTGDVHGSSHWASPKEVQAAGLLTGEPSVVVGAWLPKRRPTRLGTRYESPVYLRDASDRHTLVFAPSGAGKSSALVVPTLLEYPGSTLVLDIKGELWHLTAGCREKELGNVCLRFDPSAKDGTSARYNPLLTIPKGDEAVKYAMALADVLVDPDGKSLSRDFWQASAHALLVSVILHVLYAEPEKTLAACYYFIANSKRPFEKSLRAMLMTQHDPKGEFQWTDPITRAATKTHPVVASGARAALDMEERTRSGVVATTLTYLSLFTDPIVAANTATSDFTAEDLVRHEKPVSLYLTIAPAELPRLRPLVRIVLNQICQRLTYRMDHDRTDRGGPDQGETAPDETARDEDPPEPAARHPLLLMLDEFTVLGRLDFFTTAIGYLRGYGIRVYLSIQSLARLHDVYGEYQSITTNCAVQVAFAPADTTTAKLLSEMTGTFTVNYEKRALTSGSLGLGLQRAQYSQAESARPLLTPDEVRRLPAEESVVFVAGHAPVRARRRRYFENPELARRAAIPPPRGRSAIEHDWSGWLDHQAIVPDDSSLDDGPPGLPGRPRRF